MSFSLKKLQIPIVVLSLLMVASAKVAEKPNSPPEVHDSFSVALSSASDFDSQANSLQWDCLSVPSPIQSQPRIPGHFSLEAAVLYFRPFEGGLCSISDSVSVTNAIVDDLLVSTLEGNSCDLTFKWSAGTRVGLGYEFSQCKSCINVVWTHFNSHTNWGQPLSKRNWDVQFNVVDFFYRFNYCAPCSLTLTPFVGIKYGKIDQNLESYFVHTIDDIRSKTSRGQLQEDFSGVGPLFGLDGDWRVNYGFSFYETLSLASLYGRYHLASNITHTVTTGVNIDHLKQRIEACQYVVDVGLGLRWRTKFCKDRLLMLQLGFEMHRYFNHNQFSSGDFSLDGVSFSLNFNY